MKTLVVDLDGTLIRSDTTYELMLLCLRWAPLHFLVLVPYLLINRAGAKKWLATRLGDHIDPMTLPYHTEVIDLIEQYRERGGKVELVSGTDHLIVQRICEHLGLFDHWQGSNDEKNLVSGNKAELLRERHGREFLYAGNSNQDLAVWRASAGGFGVNAPKKAYELRDESGQEISIAKLVENRHGLAPIIRSLKLHHWAKNLLIFFIPALFLPSLTTANYLHLAIGFLAFGMVASGTYLLNDLFDIQDDRAHETKRHRPLAAGTLSIPVAISTAAALVAGAIAMALMISPAFLAILLTYALVTSSYSFRLKQIPVIDVLVLAGLFVIRVTVGGIIIGQLPTAWLISCTGFMFLSLALAKRYVEVQKLENGRSAPGRGYQSGDALFILVFGAASAVCAVLAMVIYGVLEDQRAIENTWIVLLIVPLIMAWIMRIWMIAVRGELHYDPVLFAVKDVTSLILFATVGLLITADKYVQFGPIMP